MLRWKSKLSVLLERHLQMRREEIGISLKLGRRAAERERGNWNLVKITGESVLIICFQFLTRGYLLKAQSAFPPTKTNNTNGIILSRWCSSNDRIFFKINTSGQEISKVNASKKKKSQLLFLLMTCWSIVAWPLPWCTWRGCSAWPWTHLQSHRDALALSCKMSSSLSLQSCQEPVPCTRTVGLLSYL